MSARSPNEETTPFLKSLKTYFRAGLAINCKGDSPWISHEEELQIFFLSRLFLLVFLQFGESPYLKSMYHYTELLYEKKLFPRRHKNYFLRAECLQSSFFAHFG